MEVKKLVLGVFQTNTYIVLENNHALIIDPAANSKKILEWVNGYHVDAICLTHGHFDHIQAVDALVKELHCPVYISQEDEEMLRDSKKNSSCMVKPFTVKSPVQHYQSTLSMGPFHLHILDTSGHTKGSVLLLINEWMFSGDTLFKDGIGRCDLYGGSFSQMKASLQKIQKMTKNYIVYPGHGDCSTLDDELKNNPYFN